MPWNRNRGISTLYKYSAFHFQQNETNRNLLTRIMVVIFTLVFMVAVVLVFRWTMSAPKVIDLNLTAGQIMNKIYYRRVVEFVDYEDIIYYPKSKIDELVEPKRSEQQNGRRLLTEDTFRPNVPIEEARLIRRRRDFYSQTEQHYGEYRRHRSASSDAELKTVTVVRNNQIENDAIDQAEVEVRTLATEINPESDHGQEHRPGVSNEPTSDDQSEMDIIYMNALQVCEDALDSEKNKTTNHIGNETSEDGHHNRCAGEITSGVPALWVLLYIIIILFLFIGLAIICDDFFIASLEAISQRLNLSEDVAGATFMAAGSSAPELFISIAGAGAGSDVGVGTIVGSAVFNLLIIIALTAALAGKVLCLDWRPFVRDSIFYAMSIVAFIVFSLDTQFTYWESLMLLVLYALYIVVMKFNARLMDCMGKWNCCSCFESRVGPEDSDKSLEIKETSPKTPDPPPTRSPSPKPVSKAAVAPEVVATAPVDMSPPEKVVSQKESTIPTAPPPTSLSTPTPEIRTPESRAESVESKSANDSGICICGSNNGGGASPQPSTCTSCVIHVSSQPCNMGCVTYGSPRISRPVSRCPSCTSVKESVTVINGRSQFQNNESPNIANDVRVVEEKNTYLPNLSATDCDSRQRSDSLVTLNLTLDSKSTVKKNVNGSNNVSNSECNCENEDVKIVSETFHETAGSIDVGGPVEMGKEAAGEDDGVPTIVILPCLPAVKNPPPEKPNSSRCIPGSKYVLMYVVYILSFPWVCAFTWTVPKCDTPQKRKWYLASFFLCIAWIALVSWIMIELVEKIGCLLGIDTYTMGLVVVAVGTSVPDAISSVLVAKEGFGDMAVSNALGSNVFDINLGLGLPFFITSLVTSSPVSLLSPLQMCLFESLPLPFKIVPHVKFGLILLLVLLVAVAVFMFVRFKLNRKVTILFIVMYIAFMIYAFVQEKRCYSFFC